MKYVRTVFIAVCCWTLAGSTLAAVVENVRSYRAPEYTRFVFDLNQSVEHKVFSLDDPARIVVDIDNADLRVDFSNLSLADTPVNNIRSGPRNEHDVRVVFDLGAAVEPRSFLLPANAQYGDRLVIDFYDTGERPAAPVVKHSSAEIDSQRRDIVVAISAGHGGEDPGAIGVDRLQEKNVTLSIAREIENILQHTPGYRPVMVRTGDYGMSLGQRTRIAHQHSADFFIAIHADSYKSSAARGATVYAVSQKGATSEHARLLAEKENASDLIGGVGSISLDDKDEMLRSVLIDLSMTGTIAASLEAGNHVIAALGNVVRMRRTNVEQANFQVLRNADIPSLLVESGYITNAHDARNLASPAFQRDFASAIVDGITNYFYAAPPRGTWLSWQKENGAPPSSYVVSRGDTLSEIAERFGVSTAALKNANQLSSNTIRVGMTLAIPNGLAAPAVSYTEHTISRGETLSQIAMDYAISLDRIRETNRLNSDIIRVGQTIRIPSS